MSPEESPTPQLRVLVYRGRDERRGEVGERKGREGRTSVVWKGTNLANDPGLSSRRRVESCIEMNRMVS